MRGEREDLVVATKCFTPVGKDRNARGGSRRHVMRAVEASLKRLPDLSHEVKRVVWGDGDLVAVHFHFKYEPETRGYSVVDVLRIDGGYIREHWDVIQEVPDPATAKNNNGMF